MTEAERDLEKAIQEANFVVAEENADDTNHVVVLNHVDDPERKARGEGGSRHDALTAALVDLRAKYGNQS